MKNSFNGRNNVYIVGGGIIGASIAYYLSESQNYNIFLLEKSHISSGSTKKSGGFIRCFHPNEQINHFAIKSYEDFISIEEDINFIKNGCLYLYNQETKEKTLKLLLKFKNLYDYPVNKISKEQGEKDFPFINWGKYEGAVFEPKAGYVNPNLLTKYWIQKAKANNVNIIENAKVIDFEREDGFVTKIKCENETFNNVDLLILAAGAWSNPLLEKLDEEPTVFIKSIQINYYKKKANNYKQANVIDGITDFYMRDVDDNHVFAGLPTNEYIEDLDIIDMPILPTVNQEYLVTSNIKENLNNFSNTNLKKNGLKSFDGYTKDGVGLLYSSEKNGNLIVASGWNGGGVKISPYIGRKVTQMVLEKSVEIK